MREDNPIATSLMLAVQAIFQGSASQAATLVASLREFGGRLSQIPVTVMIPQTLDRVAAADRERLESLDAQLVPFEIDSEALAFPLAAKPFAAAAAEEWAQGRTDILVWMDPHSIVIQEPTSWLLPADKRLGYRPVDHTLIGSLFDQPLDPFWQLAYDHCQVPAERVFPMPTSADSNTLRPYFNASMLVVRPEARLLQRWRLDFSTLYRDPRLDPFYQQHVFYQIFIHQIVLSSSLLAELDPAEMLLLDPWVNYPMHMHAEVPADRHPARLNQLITGRYDMLFDNPEWREKIPPIDEPLKSWLDVQPITQGKGAQK